jgi:hypothetical protein
MAREQKKERSAMRFGRKPLLIANLVIAAFALVACGGTPTSSNWGGGSSNGGGSSSSSTGTSTFTIGGTVTGLTGSGLVLLDNGTDVLSVTGTGVVNFMFATAVSGAYNVTVKTQPTNPVQSCNVTNGSGTATADVTTVAISCTTSNTVGGTITGLLGTGLVLQDNGGNNLTVTGSGTVNFTFTNSLATGATYNVTVATQPANPNQTCTVANGSGTITDGSVSSVQISCSQPKFSISGNVTGLVEKAGDPPNCTNCPDTLEMQDNAGDNLFVTGDTPFTFPTQFTYGTIYSVDEFLVPSTTPSQPETGCFTFNATAVVTANVNDVLVDCGHNDWTWMFPNTTPTINSYGTATLGSYSEGSSIPIPPFATANPDSPGGRDFAMSWMDSQGRRWLFGGEGFEVAHSGTNNIPGLLNDMWVWPTDYGWWTPGGWIPADLPILEDTSTTTITFSADVTRLERQDYPANYGTLGSGTACGFFSGATVSNCTLPSARWGGVTWTDAAGNLWMFGGDSDAGLMNDVWEFDLVDGPCQWDATTGSGTFTNCSWIWRAGSASVNQLTTGSFPGGRWGASFYTDSAHNLWMFGGQGVDAGGNIGLLNDLWECAATSTPCTWTLVSGTTQANQKGVYGTEGTSGGSNVPGGRQNGVLWVDSSGNAWLFGGWGLDSVGTTATGLGPGSAQIGAILNDLWEYNATSHQWTWVSGSNTADQNGVYGSQGTSNLTLNGSTTDFPGSRWGAAGWLDPDSTGGANLFFFGGFGLGSQSSQPTGFLNDIWEYQTSTGKWIWWKGSNDVNQPTDYISTPQNYFQITDVNNVVGARRAPAIWVPSLSDGYVFVFGGEGYAASGGPYGELNDLARYLPFCSHDAPCPY